MWNAGHVAGIKQTEIPASRPVLVGETDKTRNDECFRCSGERSKVKQISTMEKIKPGRGYMGRAGGPQAINVVFVVDRCVS